MGQAYWFLNSKSCKSGFLLGRTNDEATEQGNEINEQHTSRE
jgi:hypothetical protein